MSSRARFTLTPLALSLALAGCAVGPDYVRPEAKLPDAYEKSAAEAVDRENFTVNADWWTLFGDETLNTLLRRAQENNADLRIALARVEQADAVAREAGAALLPNLDAQFSNTRLHPSEKTATWSPATPETLRQHSAGLALSYELDIWGRVRRSDESARANLLASRYGRDALRLSIAGLVTSSYFRLRALDAQQNITESSLASSRESTRLITLRVEAGLDAPQRLLQARGETARQESELAELRRARALTLHQLALLAGQPDLEIPPGDLRQIPVPPLPPAGLPATLIEARPDVRQAEQALIAANAHIGMARAGYFPRFTLTGSTGSESRVLSELFSTGAGTWSLGLNVLMPIFDAGRTSARVDQARALHEQSRITWQNTLQTAFKEVRDALVDLREYGHGEDQLKARMQDMAEAEALVRQRVEAGQTESLEWLETQRLLHGSQLAWVASRQNRLTAAASLFRALGGGWQAATP